MRRSGSSMAPLRPGFAGGWGGGATGVPGCWAARPSASTRTAPSPRHQMRYRSMVALLPERNGAGQAPPGGMQAPCRERSPRPGRRRNRRRRSNFTTSPAIGRPAGGAVGPYKNYKGLQVRRRVEGAMMAGSLEIRTVVSQPFQENTYVVWVPGRTDALVIDPGLE